MSRGKLAHEHGDGRVLADLGGGRPQARHRVLGHERGIGPQGRAVAEDQVQVVGPGCEGSEQCLGGRVPGNQVTAAVEDPRRRRVGGDEQSAQPCGVPFLGIEPAGQRVEFDAIDIWTVRDGQLYEHWDQFDWPRVLVQLDTDPATPAPVAGPLADAANRPVDR